MPIAGGSLADGQLPAAAGDLYTVPALTTAYIKSIVCQNTGAAITVQLWVSAAGVRRIAYIPLAADEQLYFDEPLTLEAGEKIRGQDGAGGQTDYVISGGEQT